MRCRYFDERSKQHCGASHERSIWKIFDFSDYSKEYCLQSDHMKCHLFRKAHASDTPKETGVNDVCVSNKS
jgi:hypothetical protein